MFALINMGNILLGAYILAFKTDGGPFNEELDTMLGIVCVCVGVVFLIVELIQDEKNG
jgi:hypothetical protein